MKAVEIDKSKHSASRRCIEIGRVGAQASVAMAVPSSRVRGIWRGSRGGVRLTGRMRPSDSKGCPDASGQASSARQAAQEPLTAGCRTQVSTTAIARHGAAGNGRKKTSHGRNR
ncbi:hypothetical protein [Burkholderia diffusa]|uniref:hypothetical protein n=1 Tax=Burkholderia diffusa TaxID=488732 RepID=UPI002AB093CB|nr:hypothetical protein [Burkholderia diffusa]